MFIDRTYYLIMRLKWRMLQMLHQETLHATKKALCNVTLQYPPLYRGGIATLHANIALLASKIGFRGVKKRCKKMLQCNIT